MKIDWKTLLDKTLAGVYLINRQGKLIYFNDIVEKATRYTKDELSNMTIYDLIYPEDVERTKKVNEKVFNGETVFYEVRYSRKNREVRWMWGFSSPFELDGEIYALGNWIDVTKTKRLENELRKRVEYLSILNNILRHDIGNALAIFSAALELGDERIRLFAQEKVEYLKKLISYVKALESAMEFNKPINLANIVKDIAERYRIETKVEEVFVYANEGLSSVLENIVTNAFIHGGENVKVVIEVYKDDKWVICRISDDGKGIPDEIKPKIFEKGFSTSGSTGMGLFIAKWLIESYGGKIEVKDNKPKGTIFELKLPSLES